MAVIEFSGDLCTEKGAAYDGSAILQRNAFKLSAILNRLSQGI